MMLGLNAPLGAPFRVPLTSYTNPGGSGDRTGLITVTCSANIAGMIYSAPLSKMVDGALGVHAGESIDLFAADFIDGDWFTFDFGEGSKIYVDAMRTWFDRNINWGNWLIRGSSDNLLWFEFNSFLWTGLSGGTEQAVEGMPAHGYRYLGLRKIGATSGIAPYFREIEFRIAGL
jgi:hypothetical protein